MRSFYDSIFFNVPHLRFPEFTEEWKNTSLGKIGKTFNGLTGKSGSDFGQGFPYITYKSIFDNSKIDISRVEYVEITDIERKKETQNKVQYGDVFFTTSSETPDEVGMSSVLLDEIKDCYLNSFCFGYRLNSLSKTVPEYMRFYLRSQTIRKKMFVLAQGSTRFNISKSKVMGMSINIPEIEEQRKIANLLTLLDDRIATQNKIIEDLKKLKSAISKHLFARKDLLETTICLSNIATLKNGYAFQSGKYNALGKWKILTITNVSGERYINDEDYNCIINLPNDIQDHQVLKEGDILISLTGNVGRVSLCKAGDYLLNQRVGLLQLAKNVDQEFLYQILSSQRFENNMIACGQGAAQMNIGKGDVESFVLPYSSNVNNIRLVAKILHLYDECVINELRRLILLTMQKQYFLAQMFI